VRELIDRLAGELKTLEHELRVQLPQEIRSAVAMGDLRENAEYHAALERQNYVKARIGQLRESLAALNSVSADQLPRDRVGLGSEVVLRDLDTDEELRYELVIPELANLERGLISIASPIGRSLVGLREGAEVTIQIPAGTRRFEVVELRTVHQRG
jgi:transcription elongation factor GreA